MFNNPFRQEAAARNQHQQLDQLLRVTAPHERAILAGIGALLLAVVVWALFGTFAPSVTTDGLLIETGGRHEVIATEPGRLLRFTVGPGDRVAAGDRIARQSVPELEREIVGLRDRVARLEAESSEGAGDPGAVHSLLASARLLLLQREARRETREWIVSPVAGAVTALGAAPGAVLSAGATVARVREAGGGPLRAVLRVPPRVARRIQPGMAASVEVMPPRGAARRLEGVVDTVAAGPLPDWLAALPPPAPRVSHRVDIVLDGAPDLSGADGAPCRVRIVLGRRPFRTLLGLARP